MKAIFIPKRKTLNNQGVSVHQKRVFASSVKNSDNQLHQNKQVCAINNKAVAKLMFK
jgi:hypothetical protein